MRAVNIEKGIFGIIRDVNAKDDPLIYQALMTPREVIFSNVLVNNGKTYWEGCGHPVPEVCIVVLYHDSVLRKEITMLDIGRRE